MRYGSVKQYPTEPEESQRKFLQPAQLTITSTMQEQTRKKTNNSAFTFLPIAPPFLSSSEDSQEICWTTIIYAVEVTLIRTNISNLTV